MIVSKKKVKPTRKGAALCTIRLFKLLNKLTRTNSIQVSLSKLEAFVERNCEL